MTRRRPLPRSLVAIERGPFTGTPSVVMQLEPVPAGKFNPNDLVATNTQCAQEPTPSRFFNSRAARPDPIEFASVEHSPAVEPPISPSLEVIH